MFKNIKNRMWLLQIAQQELFMAGLIGRIPDRQKLQDVMTQFEKDMRADGHWPFDSPEVMALSFGGWLGKQPIAQR